MPFCLPPFWTQASKQAFPNRNLSLRFFSTPLQFKASPLPTFFAKQVYDGFAHYGVLTQLKGLRSLNRMILCPRFVWNIPSIHIIYIVYIHLHLHIHIHIHSNTYIYYIHILIDCEPFLPSRFKWTSETPAKPQRQQWIDVLFVWNSFLDGQSLNRVAVNTQIQWWYPLVN